MSKKTYAVVVGTFQGHEQGEKFDAEADDTHEKAVGRGQLRVVTRPGKKPAKKEEKADA